jgi:hypothetical protein
MSGTSLQSSRSPLPDAAIGRVPASRTTEISPPECHNYRASPQILDNYNEIAQKTHFLDNVLFCLHMNTRSHMGHNPEKCTHTPTTPPPHPLLPPPPTSLPTTPAPPRPPCRPTLATPGTSLDSSRPQLRVEPPGVAPIPRTTEISPPECPPWGRPPLEVL